LSSSATRARETTENLVTSSGLPTEVRFDQRIYEANREQLLEVIAEIESSVESVLMVGHNPGIEALLHFVTGKLEAVPTATLAKVQLKITSWRDVAARVGTLEWIVRPKEDLN
jgi:phosphohistidine phosphatase